MENQNRLNILNQKQAERKARQQEQTEHLQAIIIAEKLQKELQKIPLDKITDNEKLIDILSIIIVFSVLNKRIATGDKTARILKQELANMLAIRKNLYFSSIPVEGKKYSLSDAIAIYQEAYLYLWDMIVNKNHSYDDKITIQLKTKEKEKTVFQHAFSIAGKYIDSQASNDVFNKSITYTTVIDKDGNRQVRGNGTRILKTDKIIEKNVHKTIGYTYIEDYTTDEINGQEIIDKELMKVGVYAGTHNTTELHNILYGCGLTEKQIQAIKLKFKGLQVIQIADRLNISQQAVTDRLTQAKEKISATFPELIRHFIK